MHCLLANLWRRAGGGLSHIVSGRGAGESVLKPTVEESKDGTDGSPPSRRRGRPPRKPPSGAAANAQKLKGMGVAGSFMNTNGVVAALGLDDDCIAGRLPQPSAWSSLQPAAYIGTRLNMLARQSCQASPAVPLPAQLQPWADAPTQRDWKAITNHVAACLQPALGRLPRVELVEDTELTGPLFLNMRVDEGSSASTDLQRRCNQADIVIVHDKLDALVVAPSSHAVEAMREMLGKIGFPDAVAGPRRIESMKPAEKAWLFKTTSKKACPNHGSSHTGVTRCAASRLSVTLSDAASPSPSPSSPTPPHPRSQRLWHPRRPGQFHGLQLHVHLKPSNSPQTLKLSPRCTDLTVPAWPAFTNV